MPAFRLGLTFCLDEILPVRPGHQPTRGRGHVAHRPAGGVQASEGVVRSRRVYPITSTDGLVPEYKQNRGRRLAVYPYWYPLPCAFVGLMGDSRANATAVSLWPWGQRLGRFRHKPVQSHGHLAFTSASSDGAHNVPGAFMNLDRPHCNQLGLSCPFRVADYCCDSRRQMKADACPLVGTTGYPGQAFMKATKATRPQQPQSTGRDDKLS